MRPSTLIFLILQLPWHCTPKEIQLTERKCVLIRQVRQFGKKNSKKNNLARLIFSKIKSLGSCTPKREYAWIFPTILFKSGSG